VTGFDARHRGEVFALAELWKEAIREDDQPRRQAPLFEE